MVLKCKSNVEKFEEHDKSETKQHVDDGSKATLIFPEGEYSKWKKDIAKIRKDINCTEWDGESWHGVDIQIQTVFYKTLLYLGIEPEGKEDQLIITGVCNNSNIDGILKLLRICRECNGILSMRLSLV